MGGCVHANPQPLSESRPVAVRKCSEAQADHNKKERYYAHTFHKPNAICVCTQFLGLPDQWRLAILLHEVGHLIAGPRESEAAANAAVTKASGIKIHYKDGPHGEHLEWIDAASVPAAKKFLKWEWA